MKKNNAVLFYLLLLTILVVVLFWPIMKSFYQQDEWLGYGLFLAKGSGLIFQGVGGFLSILLGQGRILTNLLYFIFYKFSSLNLFPTAVFSILLHILNVLLVFFIARGIFKKNFPAFLGALFFAVNNVSQSAVTWAAASINTLPSTTLILISVYFFFKYIENSRQKMLIVSFIAAYISLFFKETGIFLFLLFPIFAFFCKKYSLKSYIKTFWYYFAAVGIVVVYRIAGFLFTPHTEVLFLTGSSKYFFDSIIIRSILYPLTSFSLTIIPPESFLNFARYITNVYYPFIPEAQFILVAQTVVMDLLSIFLTAVICLLFLPLLKNTEVKAKKKVVFWIFFLLASFLPYVIISKSYSYLESRYYYVAAASWGIIFAWIFTLIFQKIKNIPIKLFSVMIFGIFIFYHANATYLSIKSLVTESQERIKILNQIKAIKPSLTSDKNIFYVTGNADYLLPGNKVPFQQGFGYTLMTLYFPDGKIPNSLLDNQFLFDIGSEGYKEVDGHGFGYFTEETKLKDFTKRKDISITKLYYDSNKGIVRSLN